MISTTYLIRTGINTDGTDIIEELKWSDEGLRAFELKLDYFKNREPTGTKHLHGNIIGIRIDHE